MSRVLSNTALALTIALILAACGPDPQNEARLFLDRMGQVDLDDPLEDRRAWADTLERMPFATEEVRRARAACLDAHRTLISAEDQNAEARRRLDEVGGDEDSLSAESRAAIEAAIGESNRALARSRGLFSRCTAEKRGLEGRYGGRQRGS